MSPEENKMKYRLGDARVDTHPQSWVAPNAVLEVKSKRSLHKLLDVQIKSSKTVKSM